MSVRSKLLLAIAPLAAAIAVIGAVAIFTAARLGGSPDEMLRQNYQSLLAAQTMREALERLDASASLVLAGQRDAVRAEGSYRSRFGDALLLQEASVFERDEDAPTRRLRDDWKAYERAYARFVRATAERHPEAAARIYAAELSASFETIKRTLDEIVAVNQRAMFDKSGWSREAARETVSVVALATLIALATALPISAWLVYRVLRRLDVLTRAVESVGAGSFDVRVTLPGTDEISQLAARFNDMAGRLAEYSASSLGKLLAAQKSTQAAIDGLPDPTLLFDARRALVNVNRAASDILGIHAGGDPEALEVLPVTVRQAVERARERVLETGEPYAPHGFEEAVGVATDGRVSFFLARGAPTSHGDAAGVGATVILQEVTRLRRFDELRSELVATVAHELRTPLTSLRMAILLCLEKATGAAQQGLLATAREDCERLQATVDELLDLARIQSGELELRLRSVSVRALLAAAADAAAVSARERAIRLDVDGEGPDLETSVDPERLQLVLTNLITNAIQHSPAGGRVRLSAEAAGSRVRVIVADQGEGIDPEHADYVFERFYRVPGSMPGGVGLGLSIAREIVSAHGGEIGVETGSGTGCRFWFTLPLAPAAALQPS
jgi:signal transduction histidine kinase